MCRITGSDVKSCVFCITLGNPRCTHEIAVCSNQDVHPLWKVTYMKNSGGISTFQGCGFCKYADKAGLQIPAITIHENPGWPGCCYPPLPRSYHWIPPEDWQVVAAYHKMDIPPTVQTALDNLNAQRSKQQNKKAAAASQHLTIQPPSRMPVPIPKSNGNGSYGARSYSPSAIHISPQEGTSPRSSTSSGGSNSSGSPPSSTAGSRRGGSFDSDGINPSPTIVRSGSSGSQDDPRMMIRSSSRQSARKDGSPMGRIARGEVTINGKRRSNSDPKQQQQAAPPPSAYVQRGRDSPTQAREKGRESPTQTRFRSSSSVSSNHPYSNPNSAASSSMKKLSLEPSVPAPAPPVPVTPTPASVAWSASSRTPVPPSIPRSRHSNAGPSITSVMADMSNMSLNNNNHAGAATLARIQQLENEGKRGVIPPHVRRAGSVISASSGSSSSTNSSAREGTVISDGAFTDYLSDDSDLEMQRLAEIEAEIRYQEALKKHEEMEFREARESLTRGGGQGFGDPYRRGPPVMSGSRIRV